MKLIPGWSYTMTTRSESGAPGDAYHAKRVKDGLCLDNLNIDMLNTQIEDYERSEVNICLHFGTVLKFMGTRESPEDALDMVIVSLKRSASYFDEPNRAHSLADAFEKLKGAF